MDGLGTVRAAARAILASGQFRVHVLSRARDAEVVAAIQSNELVRIIYLREADRALDRTLPASEWNGGRRRLLRTAGAQLQFYAPSQFNALVVRAALHEGGEETPRTPHDRQLCGERADGRNGGGVAARTDNGRASRGAASGEGEKDADSLLKMAPFAMVIFKSV